MKKTLWEGLEALSEGRSFSSPGRSGAGSGGGRSPIAQPGLPGPCELRSRSVAEGRFRCPRCCWGSRCAQGVAGSLLCLPGGCVWGGHRESGAGAKPAPWGLCPCVCGGAGVDGGWQGKEGSGLSWVSGGAQSWMGQCPPALLELHRVSSSG